MSDSKRPSPLLPKLVAGVVLIAIGVGAFLWWQDRQHYEKTDNAFVEADTVQVSSQVSGYVTDVLVSDNQQVNTGDLLVKIDQAPFLARLRQAQANETASSAGVQEVDDKTHLQGSMIEQRAAALHSAEALEKQARTELDRYQRLAGQGWVTPQRIQTLSTTVAQAHAAVEEARAALVTEQVATSNLSSTRSRNVGQVAVAESSVQQAKLDLDRTLIRAPASGVIGARGVRIGQLVQPGLALMAVVPVAKTYVVANFKETQLGRLRLGQPVPDRVIRGHVESFAPATGSEFALIPVENAVGNFTKIAQRLPVRIALESSEEGRALRPGLSVEVKVDVLVQSGPTLAEAGNRPTVMAKSGTGN